MPFVTSIERRALEKGRQEGRQEGQQEGALRASRSLIVDALQARFKRVPAEVTEALAGVQDPERLRTLHGAALDAASMEEFLSKLGA